MEENNICLGSVKEKKKTFFKKPKRSSILVLTGLIIAFAFGYFINGVFGQDISSSLFHQTKIEQPQDQKNEEIAVVGNDEPDAIVEPEKVPDNTIAPAVAAKKAIDYINKNFDTTKSSTLNQISKETISLYTIKVNFNNQVLPAYISTDGKWFFGSEPLDMTKDLSLSTGSGPSGTIVDGNFTQVTDANICKENDKPVVYFFGSTGCPHCVWEKPIIKEVAQLFGDSISYHENIDSSADQDIFTKYNPSGGIPTIIIGCKYYRVGSGEQSGEATEKANLTKLICDITGNQASVCK